MSDLSETDVHELARLARLELEDDEVGRLRVELAAILAYMDSLRELDTTDVEPMTHAVPMDLPLRDDRVEPSLSAELALDQAPDRDDDCFRVPNVIKTR